MLLWLVLACDPDADALDSGSDADSATSEDSGTDTDPGPDTDSGTDSAADSGGDSGTDSGVDSGTDSGTAPLGSNAARYTYKGFTTTVDCASPDISGGTWACSEDIYVTRIYRIQCIVVADTSGSGETAATFGIYFINPVAAGVLAASDLQVPGGSSSGAPVTLSRNNGSAAGILTTYTGYPTSATSLSDVDAEITVFDDATLHLAAHMSFVATDAAGDEWQVELQVDDIFDPC